MDARLMKYLKLMLEKSASDLHIKAGHPPMFRIDGELVKAGEEIFSDRDTQEIGFSIMNEEQIKRFETQREMDLAFDLGDVARFRTNLYWQMGKVGIAFRLLPLKIPTMSECGLPEEIIIERILNKKKGLILVTGAMGSGKSTSIASMIEWINQHWRVHVVTIEDPVEYVHRSKMAVIDQREVGSDTLSFHEALRHILREDANVILVGEMRDLETIEAALNIAETGHLVFATLHTSDAIQTVNRIIDVFPPHQQEQVRIQLSFVLLAVLSQNLIPRKEKRGRVLAYEIMLVNNAIRSLIRERKTHQAYTVIQTSQQEGMCTMNQSLYRLYIEEEISLENAFLYSTNPDDLKRLIEKTPSSI
ncbi:MAG: type IV pilus twitching motility protein PilT [Candidatus Omnitrophica bacterium]|nr:type IV pilus twitching motility protein PilT [Candidatus Omnitrophota bacterium]MCM8793702.1 type IV pilus twitching motility protein PilT [Candidatus Omnitrophota bacterium]